MYVCMYVVKRLREEEEEGRRRKNRIDFDYIELIESYMYFSNMSYLLRISFIRIKDLL